MVVIDYYQFSTNCGKLAPWLLIDEVGDDGLTKDADEDEVGNLVEDNCCGIDANDGKLVGVVALATGMPNFLTNKITKLKNK